MKDNVAQKQKERDALRPATDVFNAKMDRLREERKQQFEEKKK